MAAEQSERRGDKPTLGAVISRVGREADQARNLLRTGRGLTPDQLAWALDQLLAVRDFGFARLIFSQLPPQCYNHPQIVSAFLRSLFLWGERDKARKIAQFIEGSQPRRHNADLLKLTAVVLQPIPEMDSLPEPQLVDYAFDMHDSHYRMTLGLRCPTCGSDYLEIIGWGIMVLRPTHCAHCLEARRIHPDFLAGLLRRFHRHDGGQGFRKMDRQLLDLVNTWHQKDDFPPEGRLNGINLAEPLMLPILRMLIRGMYVERYVKAEESLP